MSGQPVVLVADLLVDRFVFGVPKRISREAPVLILGYEGERLSPGGGANAAANVAALGGKPLPLGVVGDDEHGRALLRDLSARGIETRGIVVRPGYRTPTKTRILAGARGSIKQQVVRLDIEDWLSLTVTERSRFLDLLRELATGLGPWPVAVLSDYGYGAVDPGWIPLLREVWGESLRVLVDSRYRLAEFSGLDGATPNQEEAENLLGASLGEDLAEIAAAGERLRRRLAAPLLLITRGSHGMSLFSPTGSTHLPVHGTAQVADVTGAGDTVIGTFALALASGATPLEAALLANYAGGVVVMKAGTATLSGEELEAAVDTDPAPLERLWEAT
jgi:rfaE bifunctional protein kinase chain/domain